eukprot:3711873-Alexandrium_andersonii.AAC.1
MKPAAFACVDRFNVPLGRHNAKVTRCLLPERQPHMLVAQSTPALRTNRIGVPAHSTPRILRKVRTQMFIGIDSFAEA